MIVAPTEDSVVGYETDRLFLVVVDDSEELASAIRYTCNRARHTGGKLALLYVIDTKENREFHHWQSVGDLMEKEARETAENIINRHAQQIRRDSGSEPIHFIRKGNTRNELFALIEEHPEISILVLGSAPGEKPGPLVEAVTGKYAGRLGLPVTVVPGELTDDEIDQLT